MPPGATAVSPSVRVRAAENPCVGIGIASFRFVSIEGNRAERRAYGVGHSYLNEGLAMSVATSVVPAYSSESVVDATERVTLTRLPAIEPPLRSRVAKVMDRISASVEQGRERADGLSGIDETWFRRGIETSNYAYFEASLLSAKRQLRQAIEAYLDSSKATAAGLRQQVAARAARLNGGEDTDLDLVTWTLLFDETVFVAFQNRAQWQPDQEPVDWVAGFVPQAVAAFIEAV